MSDIQYSVGFHSDLSYSVRSTRLSTFHPASTENSSILLQHLPCFCFQSTMSMFVIWWTNSLIISLFPKKSQQLIISNYLKNNKYAHIMLSVIPRKKSLANILSSWLWLQYLIILTYLYFIFIFTHWSLFTRLTELMLSYRETPRLINRFHFKS